MGRLVHFACIDCIRNAGLNRHQMAHFHAIGDFADENDRVPTAEEFAELTGVQEKTAKSILRTLSPFTEGHVLTTFIPDITTDESTATPEENMIFFELVKLIRSKLTENEWLIFKQYVIEGVKLAKIGKDRGYTEANASQTVQKIRRKIERSLRRLGFDVNGHSKSECRSAFHKIDMERIILDILEDNRGKPVFIFQAVMARLTNCRWGYKRYGQVQCCEFQNVSRIKTISGKGI